MVPTIEIGSRPWAAAILAAVLWTSGASAAARGVASLWVWRPALAMTDGRAEGGRTDADARARLLRAASAAGVVRLYVLAEPTGWDPASVRALVAEARAAGIETWAVPPGGIQDRWAAPIPRHGRADVGPVVSWTRDVLAIDAGFAGIELDVEPHRARPAGRRRPAWRERCGGLAGSARNRLLAREYLRLLDAVRAEIARNGSVAKLGATLPWWLARDDGEAKYVLQFGGVRRTWIRHVQARLDLLTVASYTTGASRDPRRVAVARVADAVEHGPTGVLFETGKPHRGRPRRDETLYRRGLNGLEALCADLAARYGDAPGFRGCGAHEYLDAFGSGTRRWP